jgi:hypothetical protein
MVKTMMIVETNIVYTTLTSGFSLRILGGAKGGFSPKEAPRTLKSFYNYKMKHPTTLISFIS